MPMNTRGWTLARKLDHYIDRSGGSNACWLWRASVDSIGYGHIGWRGKLYKAHRLSWALANGEIPAGLCCLHKCDVRRCCNPAHLFLGTQLDNVADRNAKGRQARGAALGAAFPRGEDHPFAKLTEAQAREIKAAPGSQTSIAARFGIASTLVCRIKSGKRWSHLND